MKRFHVHIAVEKLDDSIRFYASLFGVALTVVQPDYAKWMLEDPRVNFAISQREASPASITWVFRWRAMPNCKPCAGNWQRQIQAWSNKPGLPVAMPSSDKYWVTDPQGVAWETFHTLDTIPMYGEDTPYLPCRVRAVSRCRNLRARVSRPRVAFP